MSMIHMWYADKPLQGVGCAENNCLQWDDNEHFSAKIIHQTSKKLYILPEYTSERYYNASAMLSGFGQVKYFNGNRTLYDVLKEKSLFHDQGTYELPFIMEHAELSDNADLWPVCQL